MQENRPAHHPQKRRVRLALPPIDLERYCCERCQLHTAWRGILAVLRDYAACCATSGGRERA
jgi:hypothetical protein